MKRSIPLIVIATLVIGAAALLPATSSAETNFSIVIGNAPPPTRFESVPAPRRGHVWVPGYWNWDGARHRWSGGHWQTERPGMQYVGAEWRQDRDGWRLVQGGWQPVRYGDYQGGHNEILVAPPRPVYERVPHARRGYMWAPGHWEWDGRRHNWRSGVWIAERPGHVWRQPSWVDHGGRWSMEPGRWHAGGRDRDHDGIPDRYERRARDGDRDGIPDRYDRDRDNDGVRNERDRDRDGDGVPNYRDQRPDNARRY